MTARSSLARKLAADVNFALTNHIPRQLATRFMGWLSRIEHPLLARLSIGIWRRFADLDLSDASTDRFASIHACFVRRLKEGARPLDLDPQVVTSPCDAIVGACGRIRDNELIQAKGSIYTLDELLRDPELTMAYRDGVYVTLRLKSSMYHRFHAPHDCTVDHVRFIPGDMWNVNPPALARVTRLFCKNERAVIRTTLDASGHVVTLVPVAAILVGGIRLCFLDELLSMHYRGAEQIACRAHFGKGEEMGWFEHGSTIIVLAPKGLALCDGIEEGATIRMGRPLMRLP